MTRHCALGPHASSSASKPRDPHLARLHVDVARTAERDVLAKDAEDRRLQLHAIAVQTQTLADFDLRSGLRIQRRAVRLRLRQRLEGVGERAVDIDAR